MRGIAKLLFGADEGKLPDLFAAGGGDEFGAAERARRAGEWCGSTPGGPLSGRASGGNQARRFPLPREGFDEAVRRGARHRSG